VTRQIVPIIPIICLLVLSNCGHERSDVTVEQKEIRWLTSLAHAESIAQEDGNDILVSFEAPWCPWSRLVRDSLYLAPDVVDSLGEFVCVRIDVEENPQTASEFGISVYPTIVITDSYGREIGRMTGYYSSGTFVQRLSEIRHRRDILAEMFKQEETQQDDPYFLLAFGKLLLEIGMYDGALIRFDRAAGIDKDGTLGVLEEATYSLAETYMLSGKYREAGRRFRFFASSYPGDKRAETSLLLAALCYQKAGYEKVAKRIYRDYLEEYPDGVYDGFVRATLKKLAMEQKDAG